MESEAFELSVVGMEVDVEDCSMEVDVEDCSICGVTLLQRSPSQNTLYLDHVMSFDFI